MDVYKTWRWNISTQEKPLQLKDHYCHKNKNIGWQICEHVMQCAWLQTSAAWKRSDKKTKQNKAKKTPWMLFPWLLNNMHQGQICVDNFIYCHTVAETADLYARMEFDNLYSWIKKRSRMQKISPKMVNPRDIAWGTQKKKTSCLTYMQHADRPTSSSTDPVMPITLHFSH